MPNPASLIADFRGQFQLPPALLARAPGRINLAGEHVDYNEGVVLPVAIDRFVQIAAAPAAGSTVAIRAGDLNEIVSFRLDQLAQHVDSAGKPLPAWAAYPAGVAWALQEAGYPVVGMQAVFNSNVPSGAGLSSSAAVEVAFAFAWQALGGWKAERLALAQACQQAENLYVGVKCGLMDQFASACGMAGQVMIFDTRSLDWEALPLPPGTAIVVADTGLRRSLAAIAYNERRAACEQAVLLLQRYLPKVKALRDISSVEFAAYSAFLPPEIRKRAEHVVVEMARVSQAISCLRRGDIQYFGGLMYASHHSLRDLYEVSCPEIDYLVEVTRKLPGCYGARLSGAGFGGCTVNLVEEAQAPEFIQKLKEKYKRHTGKEAAVYLCHASRGAGVQRLA
jgi:galactokinase